MLSSINRSYLSPPSLFSVFVIVVSLSCYVAQANREFIVLPILALNLKYAVSASQLFRFIKMNFPI